MAIDGQVDRAHVFDHAAQAILDHAAASRATRQLLVERKLDTFLALILDVIEADNVGRHLAFRVIASRLGLLVDTGNAQFGDFGSSLERHLALEIHEGLVFVGKLLAQLGGGHLKQRRELIQFGGRRLVGVLRYRPHRARRNAGGQHHAVSVQDLAATGRQRQRALIAARTFCHEEFGRHPLQIPGTQGQRDERQTEQDQHKPSAPHGELHAQHGVIEEGHALHRTTPCASAAGAVG